MEMTIIKLQQTHSLDASPVVNLFCFKNFFFTVGRLDIPASSTTELSELGRDFFTRLFEKCDKVCGIVDSVDF